ncbi:hypothetical protein PInf_013187 [Phytophthora infestans]|nr:hypothetical protein PInf_013187 [Phytophthora infestans]
MKDRNIIQFNKTNSYRPAAKSGPVVRVREEDDDESVAYEAQSAVETCLSLAKPVTRFGGDGAWQSPRTLALGCISFAAFNLSLMRGALVLGEAIEYLNFISCLVSFIGVMFVTRPAFLFASSYITMRQLKELNYVVINHFLLFGLLYALATLWYFGVSFSLPAEINLMVALLGSGLFAFVGQVFLTMGFQQSNAGIASVMRYLDVVFVLF